MSILKVTRMYKHSSSYLLYHSADISPNCQTNKYPQISRQNRRKSPQIGAMLTENQQFIIYEDTGQSEPGNFEFL